MESFGETPLIDEKQKKFSMDFAKLLKTGVFLHGDLFSRALRLAYYAHDGQTRRYTNDPYILHPIRVALQLERSKFLDRFSDEMPSMEILKCIALLHDVLEDTTVDEIIMRIIMGDDITNGVKWLTNPSKGSKLPRADRKAMDRTHAKHAPFHIRQIKLVDRLDNLMDMEGASTDFTKIYLDESELLVNELGLRGSVWKDQLVERIAMMRKALQ